MTYFDGETFERDGREFKFQTEYDELSSVFDDGDWFGELVWAKRDQYTDYIGSEYPRPSHFNGASERIDRSLSGRGATCDEPLWWQPPADVKRGTSEFDTLRQALVSALEDGYCVVIVTDVETGDVESLGGYIASYRNPDLDDAANELSDQLNARRAAEIAGKQWALDHEIVTV